MDPVSCTNWNNSFFYFHPRGNYFPYIRSEEMLENRYFLVTASGYDYRAIVLFVTVIILKIIKKLSCEIRLLFAFSIYVKAIPCKIYSLKRISLIVVTTKN